MKKLKLLSLLLATSAVGALSVGVANAADPVTTDGGVIHFTGSIVNTACSLNMDSVDQTVMLGPVTTTALFPPAKIPQQSFHIQLDNCQFKDTAPGLSLTFSGLDDITNQAFAIESGVGAAKGVGVALFDSSGQRVTPEKPVVLGPIAAGSNRYNFKAQYVVTQADPGPTPGEANTQVTFTMTYS